MTDTISIWPSKFKATALHASITICTAILTGYIVFYIWYPGRLAEMLGGTELYWLIVLVEISLGPLTSLVIYNPTKLRSELIRDYSIVVLIQLSALIYGLYVVAQSRPVFFVFAKDSFEVVTALELDEEDLQQANAPAFQKRSWLGPIFTCTSSPTDKKEKSDLLFSALDGKDIQLFPKYYRECNKGEIYQKTHKRELLLDIIKRKFKSDEKILSLLPSGDFTWLPLKHRFGAWVAIYSGNNTENFLYIPIDPYES